MSIDMKLVGYIGIAPLDTLENTAAKLSRALENIDFFEDDSGRFDEFPAYCSCTLGCELILLGIPDEDDYLGDEPLDYFELQIKNRDKDKIGRDVNLALFFIEKIKSNSDINCWILD